MRTTYNNGYMNIPLLSNVQTGKLVAVFDIGSGSVGAGIIELRKDRPSIVHVSHRQVLSQEERTEKHLERIAC